MKDSTAKSLKKWSHGENLYFEEDIESVKEPVRAEVLFYDPINSQVRFQTRLDERAAREILKVRSFGILKAMERTPIAGLLAPR